MNLNSFVNSFRTITRTDAGINGDAQRIEQMAWLLFLKIYDQLEELKSFEDDDYQSIIPKGFHWHEWANTDSKECLKGNELLDFVDIELIPKLRTLKLPNHCPRSKAIVKAVFADVHNYAKDGISLRQCLELINSCNFEDTNEMHAFGAVYEKILSKLQSAGSAGEFYTPRVLTDFMSRHVDLKIGDSVADFACGTGGFLNSAHKYLESELGDDAEKRRILNNSFFGIEKKPLPYLLCVTNLLLNQIEEPNIQYGNALASNVDEYNPEKDGFDVVLMNPPYGGSERDEILKNFPKNLRSSETADLFLILIMERLKPNGRAAVIVPDGFLFGSGNKAAIKEKLLRDFNLHTIVRLPTSVFAPYTSIATNILFFNAPSKKDKQEEKKWQTKQTWFYRVDMPEGYKKFSKTKPMLLCHLDNLDAWWHNRHAITKDGSYKSQVFSPDDLKEKGYSFDLCGYVKQEEKILPPNELINQYKKQRELYESEINKILAEIIDRIGEH